MKITKEETIEQRIQLFNDINKNVSEILRDISLDTIDEKDSDLEDVNSNERVILDVRNVQKYYTTSKKVLDEITFKVNKGEFFGIVGESGSGKSTLGKIIIRIISNSGGTILFDNKFISSKKLLKSTKKWLSQNIQMVFQSPINSLNPKKKVLELVKEPLLRSDIISKKVDSLIDLHKVLNYIFNYRLKILVQNNKIEFMEKYYAILIFSYFTFITKYFIYKYYLDNNNHKSSKDLKDIFLSNISSLYKRYGDNKEEYANKNGFLGPLYKLDSIEDLNIYQNINLSKEQKDYLWNNFIHDDELLDFYDINLTSKIQTIDDFFENLSEADDFIVSAVDELDTNIKLLLNIATKYFSNIADITKVILKKITRKDFYPKEKLMFELANSLEKTKKMYEQNFLYEKITKVVNKKKHFLSNFKDEYKTKIGQNAKNILLTYLSTSKEEISSVNRSLVNYENNPIMFLYFDIKKRTLKERYNVIKTLNKIKNLTSGQIDFLIDKVWNAIQDKYKPLYDELEIIKNQNDANLLAKEVISQKIIDLRIKLKQKWNEYGKNLAEYKYAVKVAHQWGEDNISILKKNTQKVDDQVNKLNIINSKLQNSLSNRNDEWLLKARYEGCKILYNKAVKEYLKESAQKESEEKKQYLDLRDKLNNITSKLDPVLMKLMKNSNSIINKLPHLIRKNSSYYNENKDGVIQDLHRVKTGIASTYLEIQEIVKNVNTYTQLYVKQNPKNIRNKMINHLTKLYVFDTLESVGLKQEHAFRYIYEFSGGQRQRIAIARSLVTHPKLIIADEPISALDVSIQAQVVNIMKNLAKDRNITFLFIAHDLSMVHYACDRMIIINKGHILEKGDTNAIFENPGHPYTRTLLKAVPELGNINLNLALESDKVYQPYGDYNPIDRPKFYSVNNGIEHYVYGTKEQVQIWNPKITEIKD